MITNLAEQMLGIIFRPKMGKIIKGWRKLQSEELKNLLYASPNTTFMMTDEIVGACNRGEKCIQHFGLET